LSFTVTDEPHAVVCSPHHDAGPKSRTTARRPAERDAL